MNLCDAHCNFKFRFFSPNEITLIENQKSNANMLQICSNKEGTDKTGVHKKNIFKFMNTYLSTQKLPNSHVI